MGAESSSSLPPSFSVITTQLSRNDSWLEMKGVSLMVSEGRYLGMESVQSLLLIEVTYDPLKGI